MRVASDGDGEADLCDSRPLSGWFACRVVCLSVLTW